ncbi:hypothetical protein PR202_gb00728 [Eleusine coracana subsp. coracana]|uniref:Bifunctional inhibitor/plant lipid transfer protein/seed storage helical domain-containing protein n=1 Tax=Eleusine coracana subsp. coracana TaxID=191504 RepID=A0AAV5DSC3_ELECO|nr:hypothetical protein PR202_gb00728 [Eleusine coracana subsp. coracana]
MTTLAPCVKYINATKRSNLPGCCNAIWNLIVASRRNNTSTAARQATCECLKQQSSNFVHGNKLMIMASLAGRCRMNIPYPFPISPLTDCSRYILFICIFNFDQHQFLNFRGFHFHVANK